MTLPLHGFPDWQHALQQADLQVFTGIQGIAVGQTLSSGIIDMRLYSSYYVTVDAAVSVAPTAYNDTLIRFTWFNDPGASVVIWRDDFHVHPWTTPGSGFPVPYERFYAQGPLKGPYLRVEQTNNGPDAQSAGIGLLGNSRSLPGHMIRESGGLAIPADFSTDPFLLADVTNLAAGASKTFALRINPGETWIRTQNPGQPGTWTLRTPDGLVLEAIAQVAGVTGRQFINFPRKSVRVTVQNTGAGAGDFDTRIVGRHDLM